MPVTLLRRTAAGTTLATAMLLTVAHAQQAAPPPAAPAAPATAPAAPADQAPAPAPTGLQLGAGISLDPLQENHSNNNFGQLFTDRNNQFQLNQILLTLHRDLDPKVTDFQWGFKVQGLYGSDARFLHYLGELDTNISDRYQLAPIEVDAQFHLPILSEGGVDLKVGQYPTPLGFEVIDPSGNPFYSHSYIFDFGLPFLHTGALAVWHAAPIIDVYLGIDTGNQTTFGNYAGDNNGAPAGIIGFQLNNLVDGKLTVLALSHMGPENSSRLVANASGYMRYYNDIVATFKANDKLTLVTEANLTHDDYGIGGNGANAGGVAQYASYTLTDSITLNGRAELYRDDKGYFVAEFPGNLDAVHALAGLPNTSLGIGQGTYGEITLGATYKPAGLPAPIAGLLLRPEVRWDRTLTDSHAYQGFNARDSLTLSGDVVLQF